MLTTPAIEASTNAGSFSLNASENGT